MAIAEIKWKLVKDTYFFDTTTCYLSENGNHLFYNGAEKRIEILIDDLNELVRKGCAVWLELGEYEFGLDKLSKCPTTTWYGIHQMLYSLEPWGVIKESKESSRKSIKEERYDVELSDYTGSIVDEETFDKKSDAIQWAKDNGRNCYARIWDNEEGKTVKEWKVKSIKESKTMTFEEFKKLCNDNFGYAIMDFNEYKGSYIVVVSSNKKATELFTKALRKKGLECTFYELKDPNSKYYRCYEIMCV